MLRPAAKTSSERPTFAASRQLTGTRYTCRHLHARSNHVYFISLPQDKGKAAYLVCLHRDAAKEKPVYQRYLDWLKRGMSAGEAYIERATIHVTARRFLQVVPACLCLLPKPRQTRRLGSFLKLRFVS